MTMKEQADRILYENGLLAELSKYGTPHLIGSYRMNMMAWNDLDIDIENENMSRDRLYHLSQFVFDAFHPVWYEAKEIDDGNKRVWFHGFETVIGSELWNVDIWFLDRDAIRQAEEYCDRISRQTQLRPELKERIIRIKRELIARKLYAFDQYTSVDVYDAVINRHIVDTEDFLANYRKH